MREQDFFQHIAVQLGRPRPLVKAPERSAVGVPEFWLNYNLPTAERVEKFRDELEKLGGHVSLYRTLDALHVGLNNVLRELSPTAVGTWGSTFLEEFGLEAPLQAYTLVPWQPDQDGGLVARTATLDVGLTGCDYAVADTGSVVLLATAEQGRSVSLLPSIHIVLIKQSQIRTRSGEVFADLAERFPDRTQQPSSINFITGPSRSSDIENDLSIGVHGPAAVFALVLLDENGQPEI